MDILASNKSANTDSLKDKRKLPVFIHSQLDDLPLSMEAFRVYCHLARRAGSDNKAFPSYRSMGETCFRGSYPSSKAEVLRRKAIEAVKELIAWNLITKKDDKRKNGSCTTNTYALTDDSEWFQPIPLPSSNARGKKAKPLPSNEKTLSGSVPGTLGGSAGGTLGVVLGEHHPSAGGTLGSAGGTPLEVIPLEFNPNKEIQKEGSNSTDAAAFLSSDLDPEEEAPTSLASNPSQHVTHETVTEVLDPKDKGSAPARDNRNIEMLLAYGFELTRQLERIALKYDREEIQKSLTHLTNCKKTQAIKNDAGWLTSCLRDKWYLSDFSLVQAQSSDGVENETKKEPPKPTWRLMTPEEEEARRLAEEEKNRKAREAMEQWKEQNKGLIREIRAQAALGATAKRNPAVAPARPPVIEETLEENMARIAKEKVRLLAEFRKMRLEESEQGDDLEF